jgi:hypothetical protein
MIKDVGIGLKRVLRDNIVNLRVYALHEMPDKISGLPCVIIALGQTNYVTAFEASSTYHDIDLRLIILLAKQDNPSAFNKMLEYVEDDGDRSILAAIQADPTLDGSCDHCILRRNLGIGVTEWGATVYLSTEFELSVFL